MAPLSHPFWSASAGSVLQSDVDATGGQVEAQADLGCRKLDHYTFLVFQIDRVSAAGDGCAGRQGHVVAVEVGQLLQMIDIAAGRDTARTDVDNRQAIDSEVVPAVLKSQRAIAPLIADARCDRP